MTRRPIIAGNWKLNKTIREAVTLAEGLKTDLAQVKDVDIVICPVFIALSEVFKAIKDSNIRLGGQDTYWQESGAFTGEVSAPLLKDAGCSFVIIGHSERRQYFQESDVTVNNKIKSVLQHKLTPIVCVGEKLEEREKNLTFKVVEQQLKGAMSGIGASEAKKIVLAYEPVWAIGTGKTATPEQAEEVHAFIRGELKQLYDQDTADTMRIQYGGSVTPDNIKNLMAQKNIDGALVGGASLKIDSFVKIVKFNHGGN